MACPTSTLTGCDFGQFLVTQLPVFDEVIMEDITPTDSWALNMPGGTLEVGMPPEITQDRFRGVWPNTTKRWRKVPTEGPGCLGNPCDPPEHQIGWGADRLTWYEEAIEWQTPLLCFDQMMTLTHAREHLDQIIGEILRPSTAAIQSDFSRKRALQWAKRKNTANNRLTPFTFQWAAGPDATEDIYFECSVPPTDVYKLAPQMLQQRFEPLMRIGYGGKNPFKETAPFIEFCGGISTAWELDHLGGQTGFGGVPSVTGNWRFESWGSQSEYWRYGFSGKIGNYMWRTDPMGLRFQFVVDKGAGAAPNRYRYQIVLPYRNGITTGAGGAAGLGRDENPDYDQAPFEIGFIHHKMAMMLMVRSSGTINSQMPFGMREFGGKWQFVMDNLGADVNGVAIQNKRRNKGQFIADYRYALKPLHIEFEEAWFYRREPFCLPQISNCNPDPLPYPQEYNSALPACPLPAQFIPAGSIPAAGIIPTDTFEPAVNT